MVIHKPNLSDIITNWNLSPVTTGTHLKIFGIVPLLRDETSVKIVWIVATGI